ncbi:MAG: hypothetical protein PHD81_01170 [Candidatus Nanoarchaeia archaeon]|nr:hypothetical protein [Candidatus Nanoarchaeia archaeon]MDD5587701.1 hypothetical protein [Candidatus Nanoarchaeia archaeon]
MWSIDALLNSIATDAVEEGSRDHFYDEASNREFIPENPERYKTDKKSNLPPINFDLELIRGSDGHLYWVE